VVSGSSVPLRRKSSPFSPMIIPFVTFLDNRERELQHPFFPGQNLLSSRMGLHRIVCPRDASPFSLESPDNLAIPPPTPRSGRFSPIAGLSPPPLCPLRIQSRSSLTTLLTLVPGRSRVIRHRRYFPRFCPQMDLLPDRESLNFLFLSSASRLFQLDGLFFFEVILRAGPGAQS